MKFAQIVSINIGLPQVLVDLEGTEVTTGFSKSSIQGSIYLAMLNFEGDGQADLKHHGGVDKAVCVYPAEHYDYWRKALDRDFGSAAFGENLTTRGLTEKDVCIGDMFKLGEAVVQVTQPRQPCYKLAFKHKVRNLPLLVQDTGFTGYYFRVLKEGWVSAADQLQLIQPDSAQITIAYANQIMHHDKTHKQGIEAVLHVSALSASWRRTLQNRLNGIYEDQKGRIEG